MNAELREELQSILKQTSFTKLYEKLCLHGLPYKFLFVRCCRTVQQVFVAIVVILVDDEVGDTVLSAVMFILFKKMTWFLARKIDTCKTLKINVCEDTLTG